MILTKIHKKLIVVQVIKFKIKYFDLTIYQMNRNNDAYISVLKLHHQERL